MAFCFLREKGKKERISFSFLNCSSHTTADFDFAWKKGNINTTSLLHIHEEIGQIEHVVFVSAFQRFCCSVLESRVGGLEDEL